MPKASKKVRSGDPATPSVVRPHAQRVGGPVHGLPGRDRAAPEGPVSAPDDPATDVSAPDEPAVGRPGPARRLDTAAAVALLGAKKIKKKCCRSRPRCKGCPVVLMRTARLQESGLTGKELKKAVKRARAA